MNKLEEIMGVPFQVFWFDNLENLSVAMAAEEIDVAGSLCNNYKLAHSMGVTLTTPYISGGVYWIKNENSGENALPMYHYVSDNIPFYQSEDLTMVWDMKEALDQVEKSTAASIICDPNITDYYLSLYEYDNITVQAVSNVLNEMSFGVANHIDVSMVGMLNRAILFLDTFEIDEVIFKHTSVKPEYTHWDFISNYAFEFYMVITFVGVCIFISVYRTSKKFRELSRRDGLTKLYNSGYFHEYLEEKLPKVTTGVLILVDIDFFKEVNDNHGHSMGDKIIQQVAEHMVKLGQSRGFYARIGGDEFALLLEGTIDKEELEKEATAFLKAMAENPTGIPATLSIGGFMFNSLMDYETLYKNADTVLYKVKGNGRNGFLMTDSVDAQSLAKESNLIQYEMFQQKINQLFTTEVPAKNHALLLVRLDQMKGIPSEDLPLFFGEVAERIKNQVRQHDFLCCQEESCFQLFLTSCGTRQNLNECKQRIEVALNEVYSSDWKEFSVEIKICGAFYPEDGESYPDLMKKLEKEMG